MTWALLIGGWASSLLLLARLAGVREATARASHELRGPLTAASLALHGLESAERAASIGAQLERAGRALDDLAGPVRDRPEPLAAAALFAALAEAWRPVAVARGRSLRMTPAPAGLTVWGDRIRIAQAAGNLVANALEHGAGTIHVRSRVSKGHLRIEVSDEGPGLAAPVARLARRPRGGLGARGRGLAIAAQIAERHGGRLSAAPSERGAAVVLELPILGQAAPGTGSAER